MKNKQPTLTQIRAMLATCAFDPREPGPMRAIVETESPSYLLHRSQELLRDADNEENRHDHCEMIKRAISLLTLHLVKDDIFNGHTPPGTRKARGRERLKVAAKVVKKVIGSDPGENVAHPGFDANGDRV